MTIKELKQAAIELRDESHLAPGRNNMNDYNYNALMDALKELERNRVVHEELGDFIDDMDRTLIKPGFNTMHVRITYDQLQKIHRKGE